MNRLKNVFGFMLLTAMLLSNQKASASGFTQLSQEGQQQEGAQQQESVQQNGSSHQEVLPDEPSRYSVDVHAESEEKRDPVLTAVTSKLQKEQNEDSIQRLDSTNDDSVSKYNFIFYFLYKYKYDQN